jgi:hypothetical protein
MAFGRAAGVVAGRLPGGPGPGGRRHLSTADAPHLAPSRGDTARGWVFFLVPRILIVTGMVGYYLYILVYIYMYYNIYSSNNNNFNNNKTNNNNTK